MDKKIVIAIVVVVLLVLVVMMAGSTTIDTIRVEKVVSLAEIQMFDETGKLIPLLGTASQSTTAYGGVAARAVDGHTNGYWGNNSVTHTEGKPDDWWQFKFTAPLPIKKGYRIKVWNRTDCCGERMAPSVIKLLSKDRVVWEHKLGNKPVFDLPIVV